METHCFIGKGIPGPKAVATTIKTNTLHPMYEGTAIKPPALPYFFGTKAKQ